MSHTITNLFDNLPRTIHDEISETIAESARVRIERIVSVGHASPEGFWYDQPQHEWVLLLRGAARLKFDDQRPSIELKPGDYLNIPAGERHRVVWTSDKEPTIWLAVHYE